MSGAYRVSYQSETIESLRLWRRAARLLGLEEQLMSELGEFDRRVRAAPEELGEELFYWRGMDALQFVWVSPMLVVTYAVHQAEPTVFVQSVSPRPGTALADSTNH